MSKEENKKIVLSPEIIPQVDIDFMNNTHYEEIAQVQKIGDLLSAYSENKTNTDDEVGEITLSLRQWYEHTKAHFARENELMQEYQFPAYPVHYEEHELALMKADTVIKAWTDNRDIDLLAEYIFSVWPEWFMGHVNTMDMMTARFAVMNGFVQSIKQEA